MTDTQGYAMECVVCGKEIFHPALTYDETGDWTEGECYGSKM